MKRLITITVIFLAALIVPSISNAEEGSSICVSKEAGAKITSTSPFWPNGCPPVVGEGMGEVPGSGEQMKVVTPTEAKMLNHLHFIENGTQSGFPNAPVIEITGINVIIRRDGITANTGNLEVGERGAELSKTLGGTDNLIVADGGYFTTTVGGHGNLIAGTANITEGIGQTVFGYENVAHKGAEDATILGGRLNCVNENIFYATAVGGKNDCATSNYQIVP